MADLQSDANPAIPREKPVFSGQHVPQHVPGGPETAGSPHPAGPAVDYDLARVVASWPALPAAIKAAVMALVGATGPERKR